GRAELDALGLRRRREHRDADRRRAVARRVGEVHRRLEPRRQAAIRVRRRVGERADRLGVLDDAADVIERRLRQPGLAVAGEQRLLALPQRLVAVHARAVVRVQRLRHERGRLAIAACHVLDDVLEPHERVGHLQHRQKAHVDLALPAGRHLVVQGLDVDPRLLQRRHHLGAQVDERVGRRHREVAALVVRLVAEVGELLAARVPAPLDAVDEVERLVRLRVVADVVEDEELGLGPEVADVGEARRLQVLLRLADDVARIARVRLLGDRIGHVADQRQRRILRERIELGRRRIGDEQHVRGVDRLPAADRRAVEPEAVLERVFLQLLNRDGRVLPDARQVDELQIDELYAVLLGELEDLARGHAVLLWRELDGVFAALAGANADDLVDRRDEDLAVADASRLRGVRDGLDHLMDEIVLHDDLELHLRHEVDHVCAAAVDLLLAAGATETFDLGDGHAPHPDFAQSFFDLVELERFDDGLDLFQGDLSKGCYGRRAVSCSFRGGKLIEKEGAWLLVRGGLLLRRIVHDQVDALEVRAMLPLSLDWSAVLADGSVYKLGTVHTAPLNVDIQVSRVGASTTATVQAACLGTCWSVDGVAKLSNGAVYLEADADVTAAE